jgi:hypothetical protein
VDCVLFHVAILTEQAGRYRSEFIAVLKKSGLYRRFFSSDLLRYVDVAPELMDEGKEMTEEETLRLFALGKFLQLWELRTPEDIGVPSSTRGSFASTGGLVMISDFQLDAFA